MAELAKIDTSQVMKSVVLQVQLTGVRKFRFRLWAGRQLLRLTAHVLGCGIKIEAAKEFDDGNS